jgi:citrate lyase subunit beta/citryl-CoA lyase
MSLRSLLFVPGDSTAKMAKGWGSGADALILDLEDSVAAANKPEARKLVAALLAEHARPRRPEIWVRINPLSTGFALADLAAVMPGAPDGIVLPKPDSAESVIELGHYLAMMETAAGLDVGGTKILPIATETPAAMFTLGSYDSAGPRLAGLTWGAEDLPAALGASINRLEDGTYTDVCRLARTLCLVGAVKAGVQPVDGVYPAFRDLDGLEKTAAQGRREGFTGMLAIHPAQVPVINRVFTPSEAELEYARRIVAAFAEKPDAGVIGLDGKMLDAPHLKQALRTLALAGISQT